MGELEHKLQGRGFALFILLLSIPFCFPVAIPMLSIPFGIVIMFLGIRIALGRKPKLPDFILNKEIKELSAALDLGTPSGLTVEQVEEHMPAAHGPKPTLA